jgi:DNA-binding SARP family transcriptional activator
MDFRVLGPLRVEAGGHPRVLGPQQAALLAILLLEPGRPLPGARLAELLWGCPLPPAAATTLRSHVHHLRRVLEPGRPAGTDPTLLVREGDSYRLRVAPEQIDAVRFERLLGEGRQALRHDPRVAADRLGAGLAMWRGRALADVADRPFAVTAAARLEGLRRTALATRIEADLVLGRHAEVVGELEGLLAEQPDQDHLHRLLALALYRSHRHQDAAQVCRTGLERLTAAGLRSPALERLQRDILGRAPELEWAPAARPTVRVASRSVPPFQLPPGIADFTDRVREVATLGERLLEARAEPVIAPVDGGPGTGKSTLAIHVAHRLAPCFPGGVLYADLGGSGSPADPEAVLATFLRALGLRPPGATAGIEAAVSGYRSELAGRRLLVVLDNAAGEAQVRPLLPGAPGCATLVTSRTRLALDGVVPLGLELFGEAAAVGLLAKLDPHDRVAREPEAAARIVRYCGLLPLAIRIAGAKLAMRPAWSVADLADRLADERGRLELLQLRHLDMRASFAVSYRCLHPAEARTFRVLGLLESLDMTAETVAAHTGATSRAAEAALEGLLDARLLEQSEPGRYRLHDLVRLFARELAEAEANTGLRGALPAGPGGSGGTGP